MSKTSILSILLLLILSTIQPVSIRAQFGIKKGVPISLPQQDGDGMMMTGGVGDELADAGGGDNFLSEKDAADMSAIIEEAKRDLETMAMITRMKEENGESMSELKKMTTMEVLGGMKQAPAIMMLRMLSSYHREYKIRIVDANISQAVPPLFDETPHHGEGNELKVQPPSRVLLQQFRSIPDGTCLQGSYT